MSRSANWHMKVYYPIYQSLSYFVVIERDQAARLKVKVVQLHESKPNDISNISSPSEEETVTSVCRSRRDNDVMLNIVETNDDDNATVVQCFGTCPHMTHTHARRRQSADGDVTQLIIHRLVMFFRVSKWNRIPLSIDRFNEI